MSLATFQWYSNLLGKQTTTRVLIPDGAKPPFAAFYLLHGLSDDASMWLRQCRLESHAQPYALAIVMPDGYKGFYTKGEQEGPDYARHIGEELPNFLESVLQLRSERGARAIGGLSMGGYGALRVGLAFPERFASVNSHSASFDWGRMEGRAAWKRMARRMNWTPERVRDILNIFGAHPAGTQHDPLVLAKAAKKRGLLPSMLMDCGTEDFLLEGNRRLAADFRAAKIAHEYREFPGTHEWGYWDLHIREALAFHAKVLGLTSSTQ